MKPPNPVDLLFADMDKLSPGDDSLSLYVLRSLPQHRFGVVVDAGCGAGRQTSYTLPKEAWVKDYYDVLEPRAKSLVNHSDVAVREFAIATLKEIETFKISEDRYGYVFYVLQRST
jgi:hypothetical protein